MESATRAVATLAMALAIGGCGHAVEAVLVTAQQTQATSSVPPCTAALAATPSETEGPYYKPGSQQRTSLLEEGMVGTKLTVTGYVLSKGECRPVPQAWLDFWQADDKGHYDNVGYRLRGHQFADSEGKYSLQTIVPGLYPGRTRHIHVKVRAPNGSTLTTQIYFPDEPRNQTDGLFNQALLANVRDAASGKAATFNFTILLR